MDQEEKDEGTKGASARTPPDNDGLNESGEVCVRAKRGRLTKAGQLSIPCSVPAGHDALLIETLVAASVTARFNQAYNGAFPTNTQASPRDCFRGQGDEGALERLVPLVIELRFFGGLTSRRRRPCSASHPMPFTPSGDWAKAWLQGEMKAGLRDT